MNKPNKIVQVRDLEKIRNKNKHKKIVLCHGVFDLIHIGHLNHLESSKQKGDLLVVSITSEEFVNKRPEGTFFDNSQRLKQLSFIEHVDFIVLSNDKSSINVINKLKPDFYSKGIEYEKSENDTHNNLAKEVKAVKNNGGKVIFTNDEVFSSSSLINNLKDGVNKNWYHKAKKKIDLNLIKQSISKIKNLKICVIGENINDIYIEATPLGRSSKNSSLVVKNLKKNTIDGGVVAVAKNLSNYSKNVTLLSNGKNMSQKKNSKYKELFFDIGKPIEKTRYLDDHTQVALLQTYNQFNLNWDIKNLNNFKTFLNKKKFDIIVCIDFGHGFFINDLIKFLCNKKTFLCLNVQTNAGNRGFNFVTKWKRSDYLTITDEELMLANQDNLSSHKKQLSKIFKYHKFNMVNVTMGNRGSFIYKNNKSNFTPAFTTKVENIVDRVGAGDSLFAASIPFSFLKFNLQEIGAIGNIAGSLNLLFRANKKIIGIDKIIKNLFYLIK